MHNQKKETNNMEMQVFSKKFQAIRLPRGAEYQRLCFCLETTLRKINLLRYLPQLTEMVVTGSDGYRLERILGSSCMNNILQLFLTHVPQAESLSPEILEHDIKHLYKRVVLQLYQNPAFTKWLSENSFDKTSSPADAGKSKLLALLEPSTEKEDYADEAPSSPTSNTFQASEALHSFYSNMDELCRLFKGGRCLVSFEKSVETQKATKESWIREKYWQKKVDKLNKRLNLMDVKRSNKLKLYDHQIECLQLEMEDFVKDAFLDLRQIVKKYEIGDLLSNKNEEMIRQHTHSKYELAAQKKVENESRYFSECQRRHDRKTALQSNLTDVIQKYDTVMMKRQNVLDQLDDQEAANDSNIWRLEQTVEDTQERFEEMRTTKKLKEILRNIAMADNFRENRAARIIQMAWRRYKMRKLKRQKKRRRKHKRKEDSRSELFYKWCTPKDHVRKKHHHHQLIGDEESDTKTSGCMQSPQGLTVTYMKPYISRQAQIQSQNPKTHGHKIIKNGKRQDHRP